MSGKKCSFSLENKVFQRIDLKAFRSDQEETEKKKS